MDSSLTIILTGVLISVACALLGTFLILRKMAMMADAISHAILPGIVAGYFVAHGPNLLAGFAGAALAAVITVGLVEALQNTRRVGNESAMGIVFPAMFALGTLIVSRFFANVHVDTDAVLFGNIEFASFDTLFIGELNLGPQSLWLMGAVCAVNLLFVVLFYKELKLSTFDTGLSAALGFSPVLIHYVFMTLMSVTSVAAFTAVGAVLVVALMIVPAAAAYLLTDRLPWMIAIAAGVGALSAVAGYGAAVALDASVSGAMVTMSGVIFLLVMLFSPLHGMLSKIRRLDRQRVQLAKESLVVHLANPAHAATIDIESEVSHLNDEFGWRPTFVARVVDAAIRDGWVNRVPGNGHLRLTEMGRSLARRLQPTP